MDRKAALPVARDMTLKDLNNVVEVHKNCFSSSVSIFSALNNDILKCYYAQFVKEPESYAAVLEEPVSGRVIGFTIGTRKEGIQKRFLQSYRFRFLWSIFKAFFTGTAMWRALWSRLRKTKSLYLGEYDSVLARAGVPPPKGPEDLNMGIGIHSDFRGGGNATRLIEFYSKRIFETPVVRIRGAILADNIASIKFFERQGWRFKKISDTQFSVWIDRPELIS